MDRKDVKERHEMDSWWGAGSEPFRFAGRSDSEELWDDQRQDAAATLRGSRRPLLIRHAAKAAFQSKSQLKLRGFPFRESRQTGSNRRPADYKSAFERACREAFYSG